MANSTNIQSEAITSLRASQEDFSEKRQPTPYELELNPLKLTSNRTCPSSADQEGNGLSLTVDTEKRKSYP